MRLSSAFEQMRQAMLWINRRPYVVLCATVAFFAGYAGGRLRGRESPSEPISAAVTVLQAPARKSAAGEEPPRAARERPCLPPRPDEKEPPPDAFAIAADEPLRISWPLDLAPGLGGRMCLRARQGANELQGLDDGWALYGFRVGRPGRYRSFLKVKWLYDGIGDPDCNNSWSVGFDGEPRGYVGDDQPGPVWHWVKGPRRRLEAGVHWYLIAVREDGTFLDRIALVREDVELPPGGLDVLPLVSFSGLAGERPVTCPYSPVREVELEAVPTASLVVGRGHRNELTVLASFQGEKGAFEGEIRVEAPSARGLRISGDGRIRCSADAPYARAAVALEFGQHASRGGHTVTLSVVDAAAGRRVYEKRFTFLRPAAWAFLGPFPDRSSGGAGSANWPTRERLEALARRADPVAIFGEPGASGDEPVEWKFIADGSCYDELGAVDLFKVYGPTQNAYCYAVSWLTSSTDFRHRPLLFQSDDSAAVWVDGRLTSLVPVKLAKQHSRLWSGCTLRRGLNPVVVKIAQAEGYWGFRLDALDWHGHGRGSRRIRWAEPAKWPGEGVNRQDEPGSGEPRRAVPEIRPAE